MEGAGEMVFCGATRVGVYNQNVGWENPSYEIYNERYVYGEESDVEFQEESDVDDIDQIAGEQRTKWSLYRNPPASGLPCCDMGMSLRGL